MENLLYSIGELLITELDCVSDVKYCREDDNSLIIVNVDGTTVKLILQSV